jgi:NAD(P)H-nitrite reductase large subunit
VHTDGFYAEQNIELRTGTRVDRIDVKAHEVGLADGEVVAYDKLLLATGARPRHLDVPGTELVGVHYLQRMAVHYPPR